MNELAQQLHRSFGDAVQARFVNMLDREAHNLTEVMSMIRSGQVHLPIVLINGEVKMTGKLSTDEITQTVRELVKQA